MECELYENIANKGNCSAFERNIKTIIGFFFLSWNKGKKKQSSVIKVGGKIGK